MGGVPGYLATRIRMSLALVTITCTQGFMDFLAAPLAECVASKVRVCRLGQGSPGLSARRMRCRPGPACGHASCHSVSTQATA